jgi:type IV secretory pathway VirJ component
VAVSLRFLPLAASCLFLLAAEGAAGQSEAAGVSDLPLVELRVESPLPYLAVFLSGDGGWAGLVREVSDVLNRGGVAVVGWDSLRYFWKTRSPEEASRDLERLLAHYLPAWNKTRVVLLGYSRGADVLPFLTAGLPEERRQEVALLGLIGASTSVHFRSAVAGLLDLPARGPALPLLPELQKLRGLRILCFYGAEERETICSAPDPALFQCVELPGGHHFGGDYAAIGRGIVSELAADKP